MASQKQKMTQRKKIVITIIGVLLLVAAASAVLLFGAANESPEQPKEEVKSAAKTELKNLNRTGDGDLATQFISYIKVKDPDSAKKVFEDKINATSDKTAKVDLLKQYSILCLDYKLNDVALESSLKAVDLMPTHQNYAAVAQVYGQMNNTPEQINYFQKALDTAKANKEDDKAIAAVPGYQATIDILKTKDRVR